MDAISRLVLAKPKLTLLFSFLLLVLSCVLASDIRLDNNFATLFSSDNDEARYREFFRDEFGPDDSLLVAIIEHKGKDASDIESFIESVSEKAAQLPAITHVDSITSTSIIWSSGDSIYVEPIFGSDSTYPGNHAEKLNKLYHSSLGGSRLLSKDGQYFVVLAEMGIEYDSYEKVLAPAEAFQSLVLGEVEEYQRSGHDIQAYFSGLAYTRLAAIDTMQSDLLKLSPLTSIVLALLIYLIFRNIYCVGIILFCITCAIVTTAATIRLFDDHINQLTVIYPILLMVVVVANAVHVIHRYYMKLKSDPDPMVMSECLPEALKACFLSSFTTAVGFFSLMLADMNILHTFGLYLGLGLFSGFIFVATIVPCALILVPVDKLNVERYSNFSFGSRITDWFLLKLENRRLAKGVFGSGMGALILLGILAASVSFDYSLTGMLPKHDPIAEGNKVLDEKLSGIVPIEISFKGQAGDFKKPNNLHIIDQCNDWFVQHYGLEKTKNLAAVVKELNQAFSGSDDIPNSVPAISQLILFAEGAPDRALEKIVNADFSHTRLRANTIDLGANYVVTIQREFNAFVKKNGFDQHLQITMTGEAPVAYRGMNRLSQELLHSVLTAALVILATIAVIYKSVWLAMASILPNVLPMVIGLAVYGIGGVPVDPLPGIAFCIAIGVGVDDTIHLLSEYRYQLRLGKAPLTAIRQSVENIRGALFHSTLILTLGFLVLMLSSFEWNQLLGGLGALMIVLALLCDLIFVPALLALAPSSAVKAAKK